MPLVNRDPELLRQPRRRSGPLQIRSAHLEPEIREQLGDAAHADPADAAEMDAPSATEHDRGPAEAGPYSRPPPSLSPASSSKRSTITLAASGFAIRRAAALIAARPASLRARATISDASSSPVNDRWSIIRAAPRVTSASAFLRW